MVEKRPMMPHKAYWDNPAPLTLFDRYPTSNVMLVAGRRWQLLVIDLDGPEALEHWYTLGQCPRTWISWSGGNGRHVWFVIAPDYPHELKLATLWKGKGEHNRIDRLCDHSLVIVPPSIHVKTGRQYVFLPRNNPEVLAAPAYVPDWVLALKPIHQKPELKATVPHVHTPRLSRSNFLEANEIVERIPNKLVLAQSWGLRVVGREIRGWVECRCIDRDDVHPSASFNCEHGIYHDHSNGTSLGFVRLALALGAYKDFESAIEGLKHAR
jgi:hypothetical protein